MQNPIGKSLNVEVSVRIGVCVKQFEQKTYDGHFLKYSMIDISPIYLLSLFLFHQIWADVIEIVFAQFE